MNKSPKTAESVHAKALALLQELYGTDQGTTQGIALDLIMRVDISGASLPSELRNRLSDMARELGIEHSSTGSTVEFYLA